MPLMDVLSVNVQLSELPSSPTAFTANVVGIDLMVRWFPSLADHPDFMSENGQPIPGDGL